MHVGSFCVLLFFMVIHLSFPLLSSLFVHEQETRDSFFMEPRSLAAEDLTDVHQTLRCDCCLSAEGYHELKPSMPDLCIVYALYQTHEGRIINLRQWFASFIEVMQQKQKDEGPSKKKKKKQHKTRSEGEGGAGDKKEEKEQSEEEMKIMWVRFLNAVDELEYLGFTRPYGKRSGDRVKLIFTYLPELGGGGRGTSIEA